MRNRFVGLRGKRDRRFKTAGYGGTPLDGESAARLLTAHGLTAIRRIQLPPGAPGLTVGLR